MGRATHFLDGLQGYLEQNVISDRTVAKPNVELYDDLKRVIGRGSISSVVDLYSRVVDKIRTEKMERGEYPICYLSGVLRFLSLVDSSPKECYAALYRRTADTKR